MNIRIQSSALQVAEPHTAVAPQCRYAEPVTGNKRCTEPPEPGKAYCTKHMGCMPRNIGISSSLSTINPTSGGIKVNRRSTASAGGA